MPAALCRLVAGRAHLRNNDIRVFWASQPFASLAEEAFLAHACAIGGTHTVIPTIFGTYLEAAIFTVPRCATFVTGKAEASTISADTMPTAIIGAEAILTHTAAVSLVALAETTTLGVVHTMPISRAMLARGIHWAHLDLAQSSRETSKAITDTIPTAIAMTVRAVGIFYTSSIIDA